MKTKLLSIAFWITLTCCAINSNAQANRQLSNLISPTAVNINLLPGGTTGTKNLGSDTKRWKNGYFNGGVYIRGIGNQFGLYSQNSMYGVAALGGTYGIYASGSTYAGYFGGKVYSTGGYTTSDQKLKQNIRDFTSAMDIINKLKPKQYEFRRDGNYKLMNLPQGSHFGLIAQDVEKVLPDLVNDTKFETAMAYPQAAEAALQQVHESGKTETQSEIIEFKALNYTELIPVLIKGMQELSRINDEKDTKINNLQKQIDELKAIIISKNQNNTLPQTETSTKITSASLAQNVPNPFTNTTTIKYTLPSKFTSAQIIISDKNGKQLKQLNISGSGNGTLYIDASILSSGTYQYSLIIDGKMVDTKQMILTR
jgi:hypothetical protein